MKILNTIGRAFGRTYWRETPIVAQLIPHLDDIESILDLGAGGGRIANQLITEKGFSVTAVDIVDHNLTDLVLTLYDGYTLPFPNDHFDAVILIFVLHHARDPMRLLTEARRVTRSKILVIEDAPNNALEIRAWRTWDYALNHGVHEDVDVAHTARSVDDWMALLASVGFPTPTAVKTFRSTFPVLGMYRHALFSVSLKG